MYENQKSELEAAFLAVLGQETRLRLLYFLKDGEKCACEITPRMSEDPSVVSRHLVKLREAGLLESRREGVSIYYRIREPRVFALLELADEMIRSAAREKARDAIRAL